MQKADSSEDNKDKPAAMFRQRKSRKRRLQSEMPRLICLRKLISMPPPAKKVTTPTFRKTEKSPDFGTPFEHSKIPSSSAGARKPDAPPADADEPVKPDPQEETKEDVKPEPTTVHREKKAPKVSMTLPLALQRSHEKLSRPPERLKLHLKHYHMSTEQFKKRTSALKIPAKIYEEYDNVVKQCETCQKSKIAPSRSRISGMRRRSETFGELTFVDHGELAINEKSKLLFLIIYDGTASMTTAYICL